jgi:hypothetical protein
MHWRRVSILTELGLEEGFPRNAWVDSHFFLFSLSSLDTFVKMHRWIGSPYGNVTDSIFQVAVIYDLRASTYQL